MGIPLRSESLLIWQRRVGTIATDGRMQSDIAQHAILKDAIGFPAQRVIRKLLRVVTSREIRKHLGTSSGTNELAFVDFERSDLRFQCRGR